MKRINTAISAFLSILLVFVLTALFLDTYAEKRLNTPDFMLSQAKDTNTYENAYNSLIKNFSDNYSLTSIPADVYKKAFTEEWMKNAIDQQIISSFSQFSGEASDYMPDFTQAEECITAYFEEYAHDKHVIKDETYENKLSESIEYAKNTAFFTSDVYHLETMKKAGIWDKIGKLRSILSTIKMILLTASIVFIIILIILKNSIYWTGTALFASGCLLTVPTLYIKLSNIIMNFSVKEFTAYNLATGTMMHICNDILIKGIIMTSVGIVMLIAGIIIRKRAEKGEAT